MELLDTNTILAICGLITVVGGSVLTVQKLLKNREDSRQVRISAILQETAEAREILRTDLENQIKENAEQIRNLKENVEKDMNHLRETYNGEIRNLGQKIEDLRSELRNQHGQLVQLLSKMIESRE